MRNEFDSRWTLTAAKIGAVIWIVLAALWFSDRAPIGVIDLLFLLALLVVVPLAFQVLDAYANGTQPALGRAVRLLQPAAAGLAVASFLFPTGTVAAVLSSGWLIVGALTGWMGLVDVMHGGWKSVERVVFNVARFDLALATCWFFVSRCGIGPMGFREPIVLLTAVHFHYSGFATAVIAGVVLHCLTGQPQGHHGAAQTIVLSVVFLPYLLAAGFVFSATLKFVAAVLFVVALLAFAAMQFSMAASTGSHIASALLRFAACLLTLGMLLAMVYTAGEYTGKDWLIIPAMARIHGPLNGPGFVLLTLVALLTEKSHALTPREDQHESGHVTMFTA